MSKFSYKYKVYILLAIVVIACIVFFAFVYGWMNSKNQVTADAVAVKSQEYAEVLAEQRSYEFGKRDLVTLGAKPIQPDDLFSQDTKVVKEIKTLETLAHSLGIDFNLSVSGTVKNAPKFTKATGQLYTVPYTVVVEGPFDKVVNYVETAENLNFVTATRNIGVTALEDEKIRATLTSDFYIKP